GTVVGRPGTGLNRPLSESGLQVVRLTLSPGHRSEPAETPRPTEPGAGFTPLPARQHGVAPISGVSGMGGLQPAGRGSVGTSSPFSRGGIVSTQGVAGPMPAGAARAFAQVHSGGSTGGVSQASAVATWGAADG